MDHKIKFLDDFSMDRKLYWRVGDVYGRYDWEIIYEKDRSEGPWRVRRSGGDVWFSVEGKNLFCELSARQIDVSDFDRQLCSNILTQAIFSSSLFEEAKKILGEQTISEAIIQHNQFAEELLKMIKDLTGTSGNQNVAERNSTEVTTNQMEKSAFELLPHNQSDTPNLMGSYVPAPLRQSEVKPDHHSRKLTKNQVGTRPLSDSSKSQKQNLHQANKSMPSKSSPNVKKPFLRIVKD